MGGGGGRARGMSHCELESTHLPRVQKNGGLKTYLHHEFGDDTVERGALEVEGLAALAHALLASAERTEVLRRLGRDVRVQLIDDAASSLATNGDIHENLLLLGNGNGGEGGDEVRTTRTGRWGVRASNARHRVKWGCAEGAQFSFFQFMEV
jgi:hypothetical protein